MRSLQTVRINSQTKSQGPLKSRKPLLASGCQPSTREALITSLSVLASVGGPTGRPRAPPPSPLLRKAPEQAQEGHTAAVPTSQGWRSRLRGEAHPGAPGRMPQRASDLGVQPGRLCAFSSSFAKSHSGWQTGRRGQRDPSPLSAVRSWGLAERGSWTGRVLQPKALRSVLLGGSITPPGGGGAPREGGAGPVEVTELELLRHPGAPPATLFPNCPTSTANVEGSEPPPGERGRGPDGGRGGHRAVSGIPAPPGLSPCAMETGPPHTHRAGFSPIFLLLVEMWPQLTLGQASHGVQGPRPAPGSTVAEPGSAGRQGTGKSHIRQEGPALRG